MQARAVSITSRQVQGLASQQCFADGRSHSLLTGSPAVGEGGCGEHPESVAQLPAGVGSLPGVGGPLLKSARNCSRAPLPALGRDSLSGRFSADVLGALSA